MSLVFNDTSTYKGLVQIYEKLIGANRGDISGDTDKMKEFAADVNLAMDDFMAIALMADGRWQFDDSNQTDYPIITTNLVSGQRDYSFTADGSGNLILEVFKVFVADSTGVFTELQSVDVETGDDMPQVPGSGRLYLNSLTSFTDGRNTTGKPIRYDKLANAVFLDPIPSYNYTNGLKVYVNREASYFTSTDTTKKPGVPGLFHRYFALAAAYQYASRNSLAVAGGRLRNGAFTGMLMEVKDMEQDIKNYFSARSRDERPRISPSYQSNR